MSDTRTRADSTPATNTGAGDAKGDALAELAELLGDPLPADWRDPQAVADRQVCLAAVAHWAGAAALEVFRAFAEAQVAGYALTLSTPAVVAYSGEMAALVTALRRYVHETQRGDARQVIMDAVTDAAGGTIAAFVDGALDQILEYLGTCPEPTA